MKRNVSDEPGRAETGRTETELALDGLWEAIEGLSGDSSYLLTALTDHIRTLRPVRNSDLTPEQEEFLISSKSFTAESLAETEARVTRGDLQRRALQAFVTELHRTIALNDIMGHLRWDESTVRTALDEGRLHAVEISGQLRFPVWQLTYRGNKLLPGLAEILDAARDRVTSSALASFMTIPQRSLIATGRQAPTEWLIQGYDVQTIVDLIRHSGPT